MWTPRIAVNSQEVFAHGTVVSYGNQIIDFYPLPPPFNLYQVRLFFQQAPGQPAAIHGSTINPNLFQISLTNFETLNITATAVPFYVANHLGRKVFLSIACEYAGAPVSGTRVTHYTFFDGGPSA